MKQLSPSAVGTKKKQKKKGQQGGNQRDYTRSPASRRSIYLGVVAANRKLLRNSCLQHPLLETTADRSHLVFKGVTSANGPQDKFQTLLWDTFLPRGYEHFPDDRGFSNYYVDYRDYALLPIKYVISCPK